MDLVRELERAIPEGPPLPAPESRTTAARRALRRRRALQGVAGAGAVAAIVVPVALAAGGPVTRGDDPAPPATRPSAGSPSEPGTRLVRDPAASYPWMRGEVVAATPFDGLLVRPGAEVLHRQGPLYPAKATDSMAVRVRYQGMEYWAACEWDSGGSSCETGSPRHDFYESWADFVAKATSGGGMTNGPARRPRNVDTGDDPVPATLPWLSVDTIAGEIRTTSPGRLIDQRVDVPMPGNFAPAGTPTAAALVADGGTRYLALYRGEDELVVVEADGHGDDLDTLLAWARERYRSGAGLL